MPKDQAQRGFQVSRLAIIELQKEDLKFSAGHFLIYSDTHREPLHGHDYHVSASFHTLIQQNGMSFDCRFYQQKIALLCQRLDYRFILPSQSAFLRLEESEDSWIAHLKNESLPFFKKDTIVLPICNVTLEELSFWFALELSNNLNLLAEHAIQGLTVKITNGRGDAASSSWGKH
jgi:6-pyruvoyltetrahydropterin/6-carboxytetrahydropterin synthase